MDKLIACRLGCVQKNFFDPDEIPFYAYESSVNHGSVGSGKCSRSLSFPSFSFPFPHAKRVCVEGVNGEVLKRVLQRGMGASGAIHQDESLLAVSLRSRCHLDGKTASRCYSAAAVQTLGPWLMTTEQLSLKDER